MVEEVKKPFLKQDYNEDHFDNVIQGYKEVERPKYLLSEAAQQVLSKVACSVRERAFTVANTYT